MKKNRLVEVSEMIVHLTFHSDFSECFYVSNHTDIVVEFPMIIEQNGMQQEIKQRKNTSDLEIKKSSR